MEYLDIVNENDEIVGKEERSVAHVKHLMHRSVHILLTNSKSEILLQLRKSSKKQYPLFWSNSVGGHVSSGELIEVAAKKELQEELGLEIPLDYIGKFIVNDDIEYEMVYIFFGKSDGPFSFQVDEMEKAEFFSVEKLDYHTLKMTPHCKKAIEMILNSNLLK